MYKFLLLFIMIFLHIVDDYYLQGWLASAKQKSWWEQNAPDELYKHDYIMALFMHGFSWAFMIMLIPSMYALITTTNINNTSLAIALILFTNLCIHITIDNAKANLKKINLVQDQLIHLIQIIITWISLVVLGI